MNNIVTVVLDSPTFGTAPQIYQYNYGQILRIQGGNFPKAVEVHFSLREKSGDSITRIGVTQDGVTEVPIPELMLENYDYIENYDFWAYIYVEDGTSGTTECKIRIPVKARSKPEVPGTPEEPELFRETVKAVNDAADRAEQAEQNAKASATEAGKYAASASESATVAGKTKEDALREVGEKKQEAIEAIQEREEDSVGKITTHTDDEIQRIQNQTVDSKRELEQSITNAGASKEELDHSIETAGTSKTALDKSVESARTAKTEMDTSIREAGTAKIALDESTETAGTAQETLSATVKQAGALDTSLGEKIETGTQLNEDITASGEKVVQDIQTAGSEQLGKMQTVAEEFTADREQITTNKEDIGSLKEDVKNTNDEVDGFKESMGNAGIISYTLETEFNGAFTVTTKKTDEHVSPYSELKISNIKELNSNYMYKVTVNNTEYSLPCFNYIYTKSSATLINVAYVGDLSLLNSTDCNIPFLVYVMNRVIRIYTKDEGEFEFLVEKIVYNFTPLPKTLLYGTEHFPYKTNSAATSISFGDDNDIENSRIATAIGNLNIVDSRFGLSIGNNNEVHGTFASAIGYFSKAIGQQSITIGGDNTAEAAGGVAIGYGNMTKGTCSVGIGARNTANGNYSYAIGANAVANGKASHSEGAYTETDGDYSYAFGYKTKTTAPGSFAIGYGNDPNEDSLFEVGNGLDENGNPLSEAFTGEASTRQNAFVVTSSGNAIAQKGLGIGKTIMSELEMETLLNLKSCELKKLTDEYAKSQRSLDALWKLNQGISYQFETDAERAYQKDISSGAKLASVKKIGGRTVVWNQLATNIISNWNFESRNSVNLKEEDGCVSATINTGGSHILWERYNPNRFIPMVGHKYYVTIDIIAPKKAYVSYNALGTKLSTKTLEANIWITYSKIISPSIDNNDSRPFSISFSQSNGSNFESGDKFMFKNIMAIDLTQMFGAGNELSTPEEFEALFPEDYYPYNEGELMSMPVNEVDIENANLIKPSTNFIDKSGYASKGVKYTYDADKVITINGTFKEDIVGGLFGIINYKNLPRYGDYTISVFDENNVLASDVKFNTGENEQTFNYNANNGEMIITLVPTNGKTYINKKYYLQLIRGEQKKTYSPYHKNTYPIPQAVLDLDGYGDGVSDDVYNYVDFEEKEYHKRVGRVDFGSLDWKWDSSWSCFWTTNLKNAARKGNNTILNTNYKKSSYFTENQEDKTYTALSSQHGIGSAGVKDTAFEDSSKTTDENLAAFKAAMQGVILCYELAEEEIIDISDIIDATFQEPIEVEAGGTLTFQNSNGDGYRLPTPNEEEYIVSLAEVGGGASE